MFNLYNIYILFYFIDILLYYTVLYYIVYYS